MNWLDMIIIIILALSGLKGFVTGMVTGLTRLLSIIGGLYVAFKFNRPLVDYINSSWNWADKISIWISSWLQNIEYVPWNKNNSPIIGEVSRVLSVNFLELVAFIFLFLLTVRIIRWAGSLIAGFMSFTLLKPIDRLGGILFGLAGGVLVILIIYIIFNPLQPYLDIIGCHSHYILNFLQAWNESRIIPYFSELLKLVTALAAELPFSQIKYNFDVKSI